MDWGSRTFGEALRAHRERANLTQRELAERAGVSVRAVRYIEQGQVERPRADSMRRLAEVVGLTVEAVASQPEPPREVLWLGVLGPLEARRDGRPVEVGPLKVRCLLGLLALQPNKVVSREEIIDALWGERPPDSYVNLVHTYIARLRKIIEPETDVLISSTRGGYQLTADEHHLDLMRFDELAARARAAQRDDPSSALTLFEQALQCWRAPLLADLPANLRQHPVAVAVSARRLAAALRCADTALACDEGYEQVIEQLRGVAHQEPLHEGLHARLMLALAGSGQPAAALRLFAQIRGRLADELGIEPGAEIKAAHLRIVRHERSQATPGAGVARSRPVPAQLPTDVTGFTGRADHLDRLDALLPNGDEERNTAVVISAIAGTAGVGKTALAVHWAHRVRDRFPDGQLYVNLRGYSPGPPMRPLEAITRFLHTLGVPAERVPAEEEEAASLYRTLLANRRTLILLDNAASADQVRPLLPGSPGCLVLVTSRDRLIGLTATEGAHRLTLDVLDPADARVLLMKMLGENRALAEPESVDELAEACAYLPLALRIASANLTSVPHTSVAAYTAELRARGRLTALTVDGDERGAVHAAFDVSHARLDPDARRLFRLLGLVPGPDFTIDAAAALIGGSTRDGRQLLDKLAAAHLIHEYVAGRYQFHDLLREYAGMLARNDDADEIRAATERLLDYYLHTADAAARLLYPHVLRLPIESRAVAFGTETDAINWLDAEFPNLVAAAVRAPDHGIYVFTWQIVDTLRGYFISRGHGAEGLAVCTSALTAAKYMGHEDGEASVHDVMGLIYYNLGEFRQAMVCHTNALTLNRSTGNQAAEASSLHNFARAHIHLGKPAQAVRYHEQALSINRRIGNRHGEAQDLNYIGATALSLGQTQKAISYSTKALKLGRQIGDRDVVARSLHSLGITYWAFGHLDDAINCYSECVIVARLIGNLPGEALTLTTLAEANCDAGRYREAGEQARTSIHQSRQLGDRRVEARGLDVLATIQLTGGDHTAARRTYRVALHLAREIGHFYGEISVLTGLSAACRGTGNPAEAAAHCREALAVMQDSGMLMFEGRAYTELAHAHLELGDLEQAAVHAEHAVEVVRERKQRLIEARALHVLGLVRQAMGDDKAARSHWRAALEIFTDIGTPEAEEVRALLGPA